QHDNSHGHAHSHADLREHEHEHEHEHEPGRGAGHAHAPLLESMPVQAARLPPSDDPLADYRAGEGEPNPPPPPQNRWGLIGLGVAGGLVPCFDALAILIAAVNLGSIWIGLALIAAFSLGMAAVLVLIGVLMVTAKDVMRRFT